MMREASITLPLFDNDGHALDSAHAMLRNELLQAFGGLSAMPVQGMWRDDTGRTFTDDGMRYAVAMDATEYNAARVAHIARGAGYNAKQLAVYYVTADGEAHIDELEQHKA